ncbi:hypothetical protein Prum_031290 [Phytohabitans rumicis]|uniref:N-acetylmuramoyl-L-alanine amidase n=1 Tax=Phytohabitans rumicis TaxID=1076125 RepID=A0A6V8L634_9ACTN|nr:N-acetylmuramoyl-L-alanine amidase [Phytohabitans rumicis]GFJ89487.1 hypothetical protein Prum_031290 [Phytohabitans rumicis]
MSYPLSRRDVMRGAVAIGVGAATGGIAIPSQALAVAAPTIASCATWGAAAAQGTISTVAANPNKIIVHHTASANVTDYSLAAAYAHAREIQQWHFDRGWIDSGQHFTISRGGHAMEGRHRSLELLQEGSGAVVGAHTSGQNSTAVGIENQGLYTTATPPAALYDKLVQLCAYICDQYGIAATQIFGHRDYNATACPGDVLYARLPQLRTDVAAALNGTTPDWSTIVDNTSSGFAAGANWLTSSYSAERYGENYRYANPRRSATWPRTRRRSPRPGRTRWRRGTPASPATTPRRPSSCTRRAAARSSGWTRAPAAGPGRRSARSRWRPARRRSWRSAGGRRPQAT